MTNKTAIVIVGPTGSGKTDLAVELAHHFDTEIVSADSRQIFRSMPIGTAQPSAEQLAQIPHHLIATEDITSDYTCARYETDALQALSDIFSRHDVAVVVGGSGLYIDALCHGMDNIPAIEPGVRAALKRQLDEEGLEPLAEELRATDPEYYEKVDRSNPQRVVRALEVIRQTGRSFSSFRTGEKAVREFNIIKIGTLLDRQQLYARINQRVDAMMAAGLEAEARALYPHRELNSLQTVGYRELFDYFDGTRTLDRAIELIKQNSRRYAKRQMTWFARDTSTAWFAPTDITQILRHIDMCTKQHL